MPLAGHRISGEPIDHHDIAFSSQRLDHQFPGDLSLAIVVRARERLHVRVTARIHLGIRDDHWNPGACGFLHHRHDRLAVDRPDHHDVDILGDEVLDLIGLFCGIDLRVGDNKLDPQLLRVGRYRLVVAGDVVIDRSAGAGKADRQ